MVQSPLDIINRIRSGHESICLYGAGDYAEMYYSVLDAMGKKPSRVVVTSKNTDTFHGIKIETADTLVLSADEVVIGAFDGASEKAIRQTLKCDNEVVILPDEEIFALYNDVILKPLLETYIVPKTGEGIAPVLKNLRKILVIRLDALGDLVMTTAFMRELKNNCPNADVSLVVRPSNASLFENCPYISELFVYDCPAMAGTLCSQVRAQSEIENRIDLFVSEENLQSEYDAVILPRELLKGRNCYEEFLLALRIKASYRIGRIRAFEKDQMVLKESLSELFYLLPQNTVTHEVAYMLDMIKALGGNIKKNNLEVSGAKEIPEELKDIFEPEKKYIVLGLKASSASRTWPMDRYLKLVDMINDRYGWRIKFLLIGDTPINDGGESTVTKENVIDLTGKTPLSVLVEIMKKSDLYIGSNTGLMHLAVAAQIPCITLYATLPGIKDTDGNSAFRMGAWNTEHVDLFPEEALDDCTEMCRKTYAHCITQIKVEKVFETVSKLIDKQFTNS